MMNCDDVQKKMPDFLENLLPEALWVEIRKHKRDCEDCQAYGERLGTFASDLKKIGKVVLPLDLEKMLIEKIGDLLIEKRPDIQLRVRHKKMRRGALLLFGLLMIAAIGAGIWKQPGQIPRAHRHILTSFSSHAAVSGHGKTRRANAPQISTPGGEGRDAPLPNAHADVRDASRIVVDTISPLQWKLEFNQSTDKSEFLDQLRNLPLQMDFTSRDLVVISVDRSQLSRVMAQIQGASGLATGMPDLDLSKVPSAVNPVKIAMPLFVKSETAHERDMQQLFLRFALPNSFLLAKKMKEKHFKILHEAAQLIVLELDGAQAPSLKNIIEEIPGCQVDGLRWKQLIEEIAPRRARVAIYLSEF